MMFLGKFFSVLLLTGVFACCGVSVADQKLPEIVIKPTPSLSVNVTSSDLHDLNDFISKIKNEQVIAADPSIPAEQVKDHGELPEISIPVGELVRDNTANVYKGEIKSSSWFDMSTRLKPPVISFDKNNKCSSSSSCLPMYNRYMMKLDEKDSSLEHITPFKDVDSSSKVEGFISSSLDRAELLLPAVPQNFDMSLSPDEEVFTPDLVSMTKGSKLSTSDLQPKSEQDFLIEKLQEKGVFIEAVKTDKKNVDPLDFDEALKNNPFRNLEHKSTEELILTEEKIQKIIGVSGQFMRGYSEAKDKSQYIKSLALSQVNGIIDSQINEFLNAYDGVNAQISSRISFGADGKSITVRPEGKVLVPLYSVPKSMTYLQAGLTTGTKNRYIGHIALGERFYPFAESMKDLGNHMFGLNLVYDYDFTRGHKRGSIGFEYMYNNLKLVANIYRALSGWKDSPDFEKGYVEERAASGWDALVEYWFTCKFALKAGVTHWIGDDISPFGDSNPDKLENNPFIYQLGLKYNPVPALSFETNYQQSGKKGNRQFYIGLNFNIPFGYDLDKAFDPDAMNKASGNMIMTSRSMFIERDYTMPLQYRSKPGKYYITLTKTLGNNRYLFHVEDGFHRPAPFVPATVTSTHKSVKFSNNGLYVSDGNGNFIVEIIQSAVPKDTIHVRIGDTVLDFTVVIDKLDWKIKAEPVKIERYETSTVTLYLDIQDKSLMNGEPVTWKILNNGKGILKEIKNNINNNGIATVVYSPDTSVKEPYEVEVGATVCGVLFKTKISLVIYGRGKDAFKSEESDLDGGENTKLQYDNLRAGTDIEFTATGTCQVVAEKPEGPIAMTNAPATGQKLTVKVDKEGKAVVYAVASTQEGATGECNISTRTSDPYFNVDAPTIKIKTKVYDAVWILPSSTLYLEPFTVSLTKLKDNTNVIFGTDNNSSTVRQGTSLMRLASNPNDASATKTVKVSDAKASTEYMVTGDYSIQKVSGITAKYYHDAFNTQYLTNASVLAIQQFTPFFAIDGDNQAKLDFFSGKDSFKVTLKNGQPKRALTVTCPEGIVNINAPAVFDDSGNAEITITGTDIRANTPFTIVAESMGKTQYLKDAVRDGILTYHLYNLKVRDSKGVSGDFITDTALKAGLPSFRDAVNTIDYKTAYEFTLSGLLKDTPVSFSCTNGAIVSGSAKADANGEAKVTIAAVNDYSVKSISLNVTHQTSSTTESAVTLNYPLNLYQYATTLTASSELFTQGVNSSILSLTGGRIGESVTYTISGHGTLNTNNVTVDNLGNAVNTVNSLIPYNSAIKVTCSTFGFSKEIIINYTDAFAVNTVQGVSGTYITDTAVRSGAPAFKNAENQIDYKTDYEVTLKGLLPGTEYEVIPANTIVTSQSGIDSNGEARFTLAGIEDFNVKTLSYKVVYHNNTGTSETVFRNFTYNLYQYAPEVTISVDNFDEVDSSSILNITNGRSGEEVIFSYAGAGTLNTTTAYINDEGKAQTTISSVAPYNVAIKVNCQTFGLNKDVTVNYNDAFAVKMVQGVSGDYITDTTVRSSAPAFKGTTNTVDYKTTYKVTLKGLLPGTEYDVTPTNTTVVSKTSIDAYGEASFELAKVDTFDIKNISYKVTYRTNTGNTNTTTKNFTYDLYQYAPVLTLSADNFNQTASSSTLTLSGARVGETVNLSNTGLGTFAASTLTVDSSGNASTTVNAVSPYNVAIKINCSTFAFTKDVSINYNDAVAVNTVQGVSGSNITDTAVRSGAPAFKGTTNKIDYKTNYKVTLKGLLPGTSYTVTGTNTSISNKTDIAADGTASFVLSGVSNYATKNISYSVTYRNNTGTENTSVKSYTYNLHQYTLSISASTNTITADGTSVVYVSGGRPYEAITWGLSGSGKYTAKAGAFDANGNANATVQGVSPFTNTISASISTFSGNISKTINITPPPMTLSASTSSIKGAGTFTVTLSGGVPGGAVSWGISGNGTIYSSTTSFDNNRKAYAYVRGVSPFTSYITVYSSAYGVGKSVGVSISPATHQETKSITLGCARPDLTRNGFDWYYGVTFNSTPSLDRSGDSQNQFDITVYNDHAHIEPTQAWLNNVYWWHDIGGVCTYNATISVTGQVND